VRDGRGPSADDLAGRAARRLAVEAAGPPSTLGEPEAPPPLDAFPAPIARATRAIIAMIDAMEGEPGPEPLHGTGIGDTTYRGTARVVTGADDAFARLEDGDVLIASFTGPAYNSILGLVGAMVVEEGGPLCHAAIVARELGITAVIGAAGATTLVADGAKVEVDPVAGAVRVL
jgi:pyruvate,water dikinase